MRDISVFSSSFGFIITGAPIKSSALQSSKESISRILNHSNIGNYAESVRRAV